jgi:hypothetical protein
MSSGVARLVDLPARRTDRRDDAYGAVSGRTALREWNVEADIVIDPAEWQFLARRHTPIAADLRQIEAKQLRAKLLLVWVDPQRRASRASAFVIQSGIFVWNASLW